MKYLHKILVLLFAVFVLGALAFVSNTKNKNNEYAFAANSGKAGSVDITGYAWSENIGWISFNGTASNGSAYGVAIGDFGNNIGELSGHAWSENIGWISFNRSETGAPPSNDAGADYNVLSFLDQDKKLQGWARALVACDNVPCATSGAGINTGGWDGWIRLSGTNYGIILDTPSGEFKNWAWGSDIIGWLSANCLNNSVCGLSDYKIKTDFRLNQLPSPSSLTINPNLLAGCFAPSSKTSLTPALVWTYSDPDGDPQAKYQVVIKQGITTIDDSGQISSSSNFYGVPSGKLNYNNTYDWTVQVWNSTGGTSGPINGTAFTTVLHDLPYPLFKYFPTTVVKDSNVQFCSVKTEPDTCASQTFTETYCPSSTCVSWLWSGPGTNPPFSFVAPTDSLSKNPIITFSAGSDVSLRVTDSDGYYCSASQAINVGGAELPLPTFRER